ncbi:MAG: CotH kinase family protein [Cytophagaceae bacterium]|nr:CotH kinase family protein [Cytophagaceae bacterium]
MKYFKILFLFSILISGKSYINAQVVINEVSTNNESLVLDEDGDYNDWIEIYNAGATGVNLSNYSLIDNVPSPQQWFFPSYILSPNSHVLVFASGKNKNQTVNHWETAVKENDFWKYLIPSAEPPSTWKDRTFNDASWTTAKGGLGYGDNDDTTVLSGPFNSLYIRRTFNIADTSKLMRAIFNVDYDDGFVAYLNGVEIARSANMPGTPPGYNNQTDAGHEATVYVTPGSFEAFPISLATLRATLVNGNNVLAIQVHNVSPSSSDLTIRPYLSFAMKDAGTQFGATPSWFTGSVSAFHTNFKLSKNGNETIYLLNNAATTIDQKMIPWLKIDQSFGRQTDGNATWSYFAAPTPGASNGSATAYLGYCNDTLIFSKAPGFYPSAQTLSITGSSAIRYTTDGSEPTASSTLYTVPITINNTKVIRAACFSASYIPKKIFTNTYFINDNTDLPVFSISTHPDNFFDDNIGIYKLGPNADSSTNPYFGANFWEDWERPVHVEFFDKQGAQGFEQDAGIKIFGNYSRANPMKSLWIKAHDRYGKSSIDYQFFPDKNIAEFKEIILRNSGNDFNVTHIKDATNQMAVFKKTDIDIQAYEPCVVYINGQYWGVHHIREKINEHYVEQNYGISSDSIDLVDTWYGALQGGNNLWGLYWITVVDDFVAPAGPLDMSVAANFKLVADSFDLENMVDYFAAEIYISNWDWPQNNLKMWRPKYGDRKFRYFMYDTDITLGIWGMEPYTWNKMGEIKNATGLSKGPNAEIFSKMLNYTPFRNYFINRYADLMNTIYLPANYRGMAYKIRDSIASEMPRHLARWGADVPTWNYNISQMVNFINARPTEARNHVRSEFGLVKNVNVTLDVSPAGAGVIKINTIHPETLPWTGVYFDGVPVTITAIPNPGYTFNHWLAPILIPSPNTNRSVTLNVNITNATFTAYFTGSPAPAKITVSEVNYNSSASSNSGDWFELLNYGNVAVDLSDWYFQDYNDYHKFVIPANTILQPNSRLVICNDTAKFKSLYPIATNYVKGQFDFSLSNDGDMIRLFDYKGAKYLSFTYNDKSPWPAEADGLGKTLELSDPNMDLNDASNWFAGCPGGSPGYPYNPGCVLSVKDRIDDGSVSIYPNPSKGIFKVRINDPSIIDGNIKVVNNKGQVIYSSYINSDTSEIDISHVTSGLYNLVITTEKGLISNKIIIGQ